MRKLAGNKWLMVIAAVIGLFIGIAQSFYFKDFIWLGRSGSLIACAGIMLLWNGVLNGRDTMDIIGEHGFSVDDPRHFEADNQPFPEWARESRSVKLAVEWMGPVVTFIGTLIWGYGDLFNKLIGWPLAT